MELPTMDVIKVPGGEEKERGRKINNDQKCSSLKKKKIFIHRSKRLRKSQENKIVKLLQTMNKEKIINYPQKNIS